MATQNSIGDMAYGISAAARGILALLCEVEEPFGPWQFVSTTAPFYNGRERGICLMISTQVYSPVLCVSFGEARDSDALFLEYWVISRTPMNPVGLKDRPERAYKARQSFSAGRLDLVTKEIIALVFAFLSRGTREFLDREGRHMDERAREDAAAMTTQT
jgi:hypothetical protein